MQIGAHVSTSGGIHTAIDRAVERGADVGPDLHAEPADVAADEPQAGVDRGVQARPREHGIGAVVCHALYLVNLASPDDALYAKSVEAMRNTVDVACSIDADAVIFHVGSHLGAGFEAGIERVVRGDDPDPRALLRHDVAPDGELRRRGRDDRPLDRGALRPLERLDRHPRLGVCLDSCHLYVSGVT